ncbi:DUF3857 domain-containing protein, partial [bacterium]|nr:DUF3857 domain-containing protein [bacterium]
VMDSDVGPKALDLGDVQLISREEDGAPPGAVAKIEGFEPLPAAKLTAYRRRALATDKRFPGSESLACLDYGEETLTPDGKTIYRYHALFLVLKDEGRSVADLQLHFREGRSRERVLFARSIPPDGAMQWLDPTTLKVSTPPESAQFVDQRARVLSGRVPGAEPGALIEYAYEYEEYNPDVPDYFFPGFYFQGEEPVLDSTLVVRTPKGRKLYWVTRNMPPALREPARSSDDVYDIYRWSVSDSPPIVPEPMMSDKRDLVAGVTCSLFNTWDELHKRTGRYQRERIEVTPEIRTLADRLTKGAKTDDEKLAAIYHWVQRDIQYLSVKASLSSGWAGHPASVTLKNGYGDCTDKAIVLASLAKAVGIVSYPAILRTNDEGTAVTDIAVPDENHCISIVYPDGRPRFIDSTATNYRYPYFRSDDHGVKALIHMTGEILDIPIPPPADNLKVSTQTVVLAPDGSANCEERNVYNGSYEARVRGYWRRVPPAQRGRGMQQYLQRRCPGAVCRQFELGQLDDLGKQFGMTIRYTAPNLASQVRDLTIVELPGFARQFPEVALPQRRTPIQRMTSQGYRTEVVFTPPQGLDLAGLPDPIQIRGRHVRYDGQAAASPDGKTITVTEELQFPTRTIPVSDYAAYRQNAIRIAAWTRLKLIFRKPPPPPEKKEPEGTEPSAGPEQPAETKGGAQ